MKDPGLRIFGCLLVLASALSPAFSGETPLSELVNEALRRNAELRFYEAALAEAKGRRTQAGLWQNPEVSSEFGQRRVRDTSGGFEDEGSTLSFSITQRFEFPGKGSLRKAIADSNTGLAELGLKQFRLALEAQVRTLALRQILSAANATAAGEISERSTALIKLLRERPLAGSQQLLELRVIEGSLLEIQNSARAFVQEQEEARLELNALMGYPSSHRWQLGNFPSLPAWKESGVHRLIRKGLSNNLQLHIRQLELEKAGRELSAARWEVAPDFSVGPFFSRDQAGGKEENMGLTLSTTLPLWDWNQGNIAGARARQLQADALLLDARRKVESEIARRHRAYGLYWSQVNRISEDSTRNLREASELADRQYRTGGIGIQLFLEVQREYLNASKNRNEALLNAWKNKFDLDLLTGSNSAAETSGPSNSGAGSP